MKANELMIGDWVRNDLGEIQRVEEIRQEDVMLSYNDYYSYDEIEPIPLTPEILEKNGFEKQQYGHFTYDNEDESLSMAFYPKKMNYTKGSYNYIDIDRGCMRIQEMPTDYVHELQHALCLCGIEKEIKL